MSTKTYDFVVEGARVAGSFISKYLVEKGGYNIAICDPTFGKNPGEPPTYRGTKEKPCGGIIDHEVIEKFKIPETAVHKGRKYSIIDCTIKRYGFISPDGDIRVIFKTRGDIVVRRKNFDWHNLLPLLEKDKHVDFYPQYIGHVEETDEGFVNTLANDQKITGLYEVGAGGVSSRVRKDVFWKVSNDYFCTTKVNFLHFSPEKVKEGMKDTAYFCFPRKLGIGYSFIIPGSDYVRVGAGQKIEKNQQTSEVLSECINDLYVNPLFKEKLKDPKKIISLNHPTPFGKSVNFYKTHPASGVTELSKIKKLTEKRVLIGEAAFHNNYLTFEGNRFAMLDAELAWECFQRDKSFLNFDLEWNKRYGPEIIKPKYQIEDFYNKDKLSELFRIAKETGHPEFLVLAFKGIIRMLEPGETLEVMESNREV